MSFSQACFRSQSPEPVMSSAARSACWWPLSPRPVGAGGHPPGIHRRNVPEHLASCQGSCPRHSRARLLPAGGLPRGHHSRLQVRGPPTPPVATLLRNRVPGGTLFGQMTPRVSHEGSQLPIHLSPGDVSRLLLPFSLPPIAALVCGVFLWDHFAAWRTFYACCAMRAWALCLVQRLRY